MDDKKIDKDKIENLDELSKKAVGSLFDDSDDFDKLDDMDEILISEADETLLPPEIEAGKPFASSVPPSKRSAPDTEPIKPAYSSPPYKFGEHDIEKEHEEYMQRAILASRKDRERKEEEVRRKNAEAAAPIRKRPANQAKKSVGNPSDNQPLGKNLAHIPKERKELMAREGEALALPFNLDMRHVVIGALVLVLLVFAFLVIQINTTRSRLYAAESTIYELERNAADIVSYRAKISELQAYLDAANADLDDLRSDNNVELQVTNPPPIVGDTTPPANQPQPSPTPTPPPATTANLHPELTIDAYGNRIYVLQPGENLWGVALRILGDGTRYTEIMALNNITNAATVPHGRRLIMPE